MMKRKYIKPLADMVIVDGNDDLLQAGLSGASKGADIEDAWGKHASSFETGGDEGEGETDETDWFNDNKSGW